jgi:hypothetical protein
VKDTEFVDLSGDIDTGKAEELPTKKSIMSLSLSNVSVRDWLHKQRESVQPWTEFINTKRFKLPKSLPPAGKRIVKNIDRFQSNYLFVFLGLVAFCILTSPLLLIAIAACLGACYIINIKNTESKLTVMGHEVSIAQQYMAVAALSFPLFWVAGAGSAVFWVIGASFLVIMLHAVIYSLDEENLFEVEMQTV